MLGKGLDLGVALDLASWDIDAVSCVSFWVLASAVSVVGACVDADASVVVVAILGCSIVGM
jgi:hypothetical protein